MWQLLNQLKIIQNQLEKCRCDITSRENGRTTPFFLQVTLINHFVSISFESMVFFLGFSYLKPKMNKKKCKRNRSM
jgi:hypothetical protein